MAKIMGGYKRFMLSCILGLLLFTSNSGSSVNAEESLYGPETNGCLLLSTLRQNILRVTAPFPSGLILPKKSLILEIYELSAITGQTRQPCHVPIQELVATFDILNDTSGQEIDIALQLMCAEPNEVKMVNDMNFTNKNINVMLEIMNCQMNLLNVGVIGDVFRLKGISGYGWLTGDRDSNLNMSMSVIPGLQTVLVLILCPNIFDMQELLIFENIQFEDWSSGIKFPLPQEILQTYFGELLVFSIFHIEVDEDSFRDFKFVMPYLQSLIIVEGNISFIPNFPWKKLVEPKFENDMRHEFHPKQQVVSNELCGFTMTGCNLGSLENYKFNSCLELISFIDNAIDKIGSGTFSEVHDLKFLSLKSNLLTMIPVDTFRHLNLLQKLDLAGNQLTFLDPDLFISQGRLVVLDISNNFLKEIDSSFLMPLTVMEYLYMSNNSLQEINNDTKNINLPSLEVVNLSNNRLLLIPKWLLRAPSLSYANLNYNLLTFESIIFDLVRYSTKGATLKSIGSSLKIKRTPKTLDAFFNNISSFDLTEFVSPRITYLDIIEALSIYILNLSYENLTCDCNMYGTRLFLQEAVIFYSSPVPDLSLRHNDWKCVNTRRGRAMPLSKVPFDEFICMTNVSYCPNPCDCYKLPFDDTILANCSARNLSSFPVHLPENISILLISSNRLQEFDAANIKLYTHLKILDLSKNNIKDIQMTEFSSLHVDKLDTLHLQNNFITLLPKAFMILNHVNITLSENQFVCDCNSKWFPGWLHSYYKHIKDIDEVHCFPRPIKSIPLRYMDGSEFKCVMPASTIMAISLPVVLIPFVIVLLCLYKFRGEIKLILYMKFKWRPFDKNENADITDKKFDAFISYSSEDKEWVIDTLVPKLENDEHRYILCFDERDFSPGDDIIANIGNALKHSRRMIIFLTNNFLQSEWCKFEFRNSHKRVLEDRSNYLILLMADDVKMDDLDEGMKLYVRTNTYISMSSPWLWERLFYSMPNKSITQLQHAQINDQIIPDIGVELQDIPLE